MKLKKLTFGIVLILMLILTACGQNNGANDKKEEKQQTTENENKTEKVSKTDHSDMEEDHSMMEHSDSGEIPKGLKEAQNPKYPVSGKAMIETDHMEGMKGAEATIVGAFDTTAYVVSYDPTTGGKRVENHKWVVQQEIKDAGDKDLKPGDKVVIVADHMKGMEGANAVIDSAEQTTVYMIDYDPTTGGKEVKNHKWVTEDELSPVK
ncbi:YdhK family protein [Aciduricibacillus chroicocephali]|uniref:YdhK family protein n=1 Tax=Aciduricibacillus chroicocephali TaxID=3054939 RepID=A0ABY9KTW0_9BACI|nr:YdhK family protein [Bacillaceae bacterium 44XB]